MKGYIVNTVKICCNNFYFYEHYATFYPQPLQAMFKVNFNVRNTDCVFTGQIVLLRNDIDSLA